MSYRDHELQDEIDQYNRDEATAQDAPLAEVVDERMGAILTKFLNAYAAARTGLSNDEEALLASDAHIMTETKRALWDSVVGPYMAQAEDWKTAYYDKQDQFVRETKRSFILTKAIENEHHASDVGWYATRGKHCSLCKALWQTNTIDMQTPKETNQ